MEELPFAPATPVKIIGRMETTHRTVIAERTLVFIEDPRRTITVRLAKPELNHETSDYQCQYEIVGAGIQINHSAVGLDAFQSLQLAFVMIGAELSRIENTSGMNLDFSDSDFPRPA